MLSKYQTSTNNLFSHLYFERSYKQYKTMRLLLILLTFIFICGNISAQETKPPKKVTNAKRIGLRSNSRQQAVVKRDNFHQRRDIRMKQMKRIQKMSKQQRKALINKNNKTINKRKLQQKRVQQQKIKKQQRQRALTKKTRR